MSPTPEQIAAMAERGWAWKPRESRFVAGTGYFLMEVIVLDGSYFADYGCNIGPRVVDPLTAADEAEAWLRGVLSGLRFPWLEVKP